MNQKKGFIIYGCKVYNICLFHRSWEFWLSQGRQVLPNDKGTIQQSLKLLIGYVGSKSNKADYVKSL